MIFRQSVSNARILNHSVPADCLVKVVNRASRDILHENTSFLPQARFKVVHRKAWQAQQQGTRKHCRRPSYMCTSLDVPPEEFQRGGESGTMYLRALCKQSISHPDKHRLIADVAESNAQYMPFREESKEMIQKSGNVRGFGVFQVSEQAHCPYCMRYPM